MATVDQTIVMANLAIGGLAGFGGSEGDGFGGGLYITNGAGVTLKKSVILANIASTSGNNVYGTFTAS